MHPITPLLRQAARLDAWLYRTLGAPYGVLLAVGLVIEIGRHAHELIERAGAGAIGQILPIMLELALLLHTARALLERLEHRQQGRAAGEVQPRQ